MYGYTAWIFLNLHSFVYNIIIMLTFVHLKNRLKVKTHNFNAKLLILGDSTRKLHALFQMQAT